MSDLKTAVCRGCGKALKGEPFHKGGHASEDIPSLLAEVAHLQEVIKNLHKPESKT